MFATVIAVLCQLNAPQACLEEIVTDQATAQECLTHGQIGIAKWMSEHPLYRSGWRLASYKCALGRYEKKRAI